MSDVKLDAPTPLATGIVWNIGSLAFLAFAGLLLNFAIARFYGSEVLGVFNVAFALYIFASQFGVFGIHFSALQNVSEHYGVDGNNVGAASTAALITTVILSSLVTLISYFGIPFVADFYGDKAPGVDKACYAILPGLWAFSINKVLYNIVNGASRMRTFAILQALRYVFMLAGFFILLKLGAPGVYLTVVFSITELALLPVLLIYATKVVTRWEITGFRSWTRHHIWFGSRIFLSGAVLELNTRVDVLMIAYFLDAEQAGIYTIAALVAEGVGRLVFAVRTNVNPIIARLFATGKKAELLVLSRKSVLLFPPAMLVISVFAYYLFPLFCKIMFDDPSYLGAHLSLVVLLGGITLSSGFLAFNMILSQAKRPASHTMLVMGVLLVNVAVNLIFVPRMGIEGAALGTALSYLASGLFTLVLARLLLKVRLFF